MFKFFKVDEEDFYNELFSDKIDLKKIQRYIDKGIDINKKDEKGRNILFSLVIKKRFESIKILLKNGIEANIEDKDGKTVLGEAVEKADSMTVRFLLENGFDINRKNSQGRTILQESVLLGGYKIFQLLTKYEPDFNSKDNTGKTILFDAIESENIDIINDVLENIEDFNILDENGQTALFKAVLKDDINIALNLLSKNINVNIVDKNGQNVLFYAILKGARNIPIIEKLIDKRIDINIVDKSYKNIIDELLNIVNIQKNELKFEDKRYELINPKNDYLALALLFIKNGLKVDIVDADGKTTLQKEIENKNFANVEFLIDCGADLNIVDEYNRNLFHIETLKGYSNYKMMDLLVAKGANIDSRDLDEKTVVDNVVELIAITRGFKKSNPTLAPYINEKERYDILLKKVLSYKPNLEAKRLDGKNILFDLVMYNDYETLEIIVNHGINLNLTDKENKTALMCMVEEGLKITEKLDKAYFIKRLVNFLRYRVDVDIQDNNGRTVIHNAVIADDLLVVEKLLTKKANLSLKDNYGRTALHHTQWKGNYQIARWLIASGADMNQPDNSGFNILNYATILGHIKLVVTLVNSGVLMYNKNPKNKKVAEFFKSKEKNLDKLLTSEISDYKMKNALIEVIQNLKKELNEAVKG
ncbi:ankyrin repeat domain-containing protein [Aliarcobacter butzleri]|uniref:ankyrin repeat domain-containing protein n=1 Tax=Aliarcobacter butzleri TaxID=28197 RepID=UPI0021B1D3BE|nr:ankyrin repeat domain-containing protein [Aliarcobacter butzleri]MCT7601032.1 ankyrin repeat domain-containing protein [Aliarcobacter butzleri]MCT7605169.1 ankyrin repeat domain-containing protein [Aliarcobacter butzleri]MCT7607426.1 ankyrin repeat domain-containing protein [Aliarcobacter butzleri]